MTESNKRALTEDEREELIRDLWAEFSAGLSLSEDHKYGFIAGARGALFKVLGKPPTA